MTPDLGLPRMSPLSTDERRDLLRLARASISAALRGEPEPGLECPTPALSTPTGVFVSLHYGERLRGCIGTLSAADPLHRTVVRMAQAAAFDDPRFEPLQVQEVALVEIEISRLGPLMRVVPEQIDVERHGVCLTFRNQRGVFLPQVARTHNWDRETLLRELCGKAMLPLDSWRLAEAMLEVFEAEVFAEEAFARV